MPAEGGRCKLCFMAFPERRANPREHLRLPVEWEDGRRGCTRDISPDGLFVWVPGGAISKRWYSLQIDYPQARLRFSAFAEVLRVEPGLDVTGVALRLHERRFQSAS